MTDTHSLHIYQRNHWILLHTDSQLCCVRCWRRK